MSGIALKYRHLNLEVVLKGGYLLEKYGLTRGEQGRCDGLINPWLLVSFGKVLDCVRF